MRAEFSLKWIESKRPDKQRKYRYNAPLHIRHRFLSASLSKELRKKYGKRSIPIKKGDEVLVMRGKFAKNKGKIVAVNPRRGKIIIEGVNRTKKDGTKVNVYLDPSNLQILNLNLEDNRRLKRNTEKNKENKEKQKDASEEK